MDRIPKHLRPKFHKGSKVKVRDIGTLAVEKCKYLGRSNYIGGKEEFESNRGWEEVKSAWTYLDSIRKEQIGKVGIVKRIDFSPTITEPRTSRFSYRVKFPRYKGIIVFLEEYLVKARR